jgi:sterol desaturase/sphingolipid hydroxylase (fatty acid hydroxylase superfamily)
MTFWSDDRNHLLDDTIGFVWFMGVALLIGIPPMQFPLLVLLLRFIESLSHANVRLRFGWLGERLIVSPRFHRAHHGLMAAGVGSVNYGGVLPWWDMLFHTADFSHDYVPTGDPSAEEALATGTYAQQQFAGIRRMLRTLVQRDPAAARASPLP